MDECPYIVLCHVIQGLDDINSVQGLSEWKHHVHLDWVLPLLPDAIPKQSHCQDLSSPFASRGLPVSLYEHFFALPCDKDSRIRTLLDEWGYCVRDHG